MQEVYEFFKACKTYYLATMDGDRPRVRPFGTVDLFEDKLYIQTGKSKNVSRQIHAHPMVEICACSGGEWLRVEATLVEDPRLEPQQHLLDNYPELGQMYQAGDGNNEVFYLQDGVATFYSFTAEPRSIRF